MNLVSNSALTFSSDALQRLVLQRFNTETKRQKVADIHINIRHVTNIVKGNGLKYGKNVYIAYSSSTLGWNILLRNPIDGDL